MGRAKGQGAVTGAFAPSALPTAIGRTRGFSLAHAVNDFNAASSERARLARLTHDLASHACERACARARPALTVIDKILGLNETFGADLAGALRERAHFGLHSELRVALDEGRRLRIEDVETLATSAVYSAAAGLLAERAEEVAAALDVPVLATAVDGAQWYKLLCETTDADNPRSHLIQRLRERSRADSLLTVNA